MKEEKQLIVSWDEGNEDLTCEVYWHWEGDTRVMDDVVYLKAPPLE